MLVEAIQSEFPLHHAVWTNDCSKLEQLLADQEKKVRKIPYIQVEDN